MPDAYSERRAVVSEAAMRVVRSVRGIWSS